MDEKDARDKISMAAYDLMGRTPYPALTMESIAEQAGVSKALLFYHFGSKKELARYALRKGFGTELEGIGPLQALDGERILPVIREMLRTSRERFNLIGAFFEVVDLEDPEDELVAELRSLYQTLADGLEPLVSGAGASHPRQRAIVVLMAVDMFGLVPLLEGREVDTEAYADALVAMLGLGDHGEKGGDLT